MLKLSRIEKEYTAGNGTVVALKGIDLEFRANEFVSILGPSGCGKTTMLNIIGGLDQYTRGDLIINGTSTKDFKDRDWDAYRNHSIGFVFQSYNLIPHQSVLQNVELALTLSGVSKGERRQRAKQALERVGLGEQLRKKPGQLSGGQMQRVAIARALVNNPDIILADEPTGALDTETSVQVMEILKEVARDRLVIMVTHNPELAETYSTRIVRMLDGRIIDDTAPLTEEERATEQQRDRDLLAQTGRQKKPSMSFATSFGLSLKNLFTKKGRTMLTSFAGSIGIIGIALIFAVSQGTTTYIDILQEDTLSSYPLTLESSHIDLGTLLETFVGAAQSSEQHENDAVYQKAVVYDLINSLNNLEAEKNDLAAFKRYLEERRADEADESGLRDALSGVRYTYDLDLQIYTKNVDGTILLSDSQKLLREIMADFFGMNASQTMTNAENGGNKNNAGGNSMMSMFSSGNTHRTGLWQEMLSGDDGQPVNDLLQKQYDVVYGSWPARYDEVVLVLDEHNELDDMALYALGLKSKEEINAVLEAAVNKTDLTVENRSWSYEEICDRTYRCVLNANCYSIDEDKGLYLDLRDSEAGLKYVYDNGIELKVTGIIRPNPDAVSTMLTGSIGYTHALTEYVIRQGQASAAVQAQQDDPTTDVFTGLPFRDSTDTLSTAAKANAFREHVGTLNEAKKAEAYIAIMSIPSDEQLRAMTDQMMAGVTRADMEAAMTQALTQQMGMNATDVGNYIAAMSDEDLTAMFRKGVEEQIAAQIAAQTKAQLQAMSPAQLAGALDMSLGTYTDEQCARYYDEVLLFSNSTYEDNLLRLGCVDLDDPATINLYASTFAGKDVIEEAIAAYNETVDDLQEISYTDYIGLIMSSVTSIINAITYVLIAFVAISLVVSSIMIGVITLISVQERTKEIGILRAIGASKGEVSSMFNAETLIIGFTSGALGVLITYLLCIPINIIIHYLTDIPNLSAYLPLNVAGILVLISMILTLFSGLIPSRSAAKKDPVVALRTE